MNFVSLFTGIGGLDLGLERAGLRCVAQVENNEFCQRVLAKHWPLVPRHGDIRTFDGRPYHGTDLVAFGDPCQRNANCWRNGGGSESQADQALRIVDEVCPGFVLRENPTAVRKDAPWPWQRMRAELERRGYAVLAFRLRACCVGADHRRDRLFLLAELPYANVSRLERDEREEMAGADRRRQHADTAGPDRWTATPRVLRGRNGVPDRMDRIKALGNAVVPAVGECIGRMLLGHRVNVDAVGAGNFELGGDVPRHGLGLGTAGDRVEDGVNDGPIGPGGRLDVVAAHTEQYRASAAQPPLEAAGTFVAAPPAPNARPAPARGEGSL